MVLRLYRWEMIASERTIDVASAIQDFINCLFHLRALRAAAPFVSAEELKEWGEIFDRAQSTFTEIQVEIQAGRAQTSLPLTSTLVRSLADIRTHLSVLSPGAQLSTPLFDLVEIAWSEVADAITRQDQV
jgi:hypothetical protein